MLSIQFLLQLTVDVCDVGLKLLFCFCDITTWFKAESLPPVLCLLRRSLLPVAVAVNCEGDCCNWLHLTRSYNLINIFVDSIYINDLHLKM